MICPGAELGKGLSRQKEWHVQRPGPGEASCVLCSEE